MVFRELGRLPVRTARGRTCVTPAERQTDLPSAGSPGERREFGLSVSERSAYRRGPHAARDLRFHDPCRDRSSSPVVEGSQMRSGTSTSGLSLTLERCRARRWQWRCRYRPMEFQGQPWNTRLDGKRHCKGRVLPAGRPSMVYLRRQTILDTREPIELRTPGYRATQRCDVTCRDCVQAYAAIPNQNINLAVYRHTVGPLIPTEY